MGSVIPIVDLLQFVRVGWSLCWLVLWLCSWLGCFLGFYSKVGCGCWYGCVHYLVVCSLCPCAVCLYHCVEMRLCMGPWYWLLCWVLLTSVVDVVCTGNIVLWPTTVRPLGPYLACKFDVQFIFHFKFTVKPNQNETTIWNSLFHSHTRNAVLSHESCKYWSRCEADLTFTAW